MSAFHVEKAIATAPGVADLCRTALEMANDVDETLRARVAAAAEPAIAAVDAYVAWLRDELAPVATGDFRLGRDLYERKFQHALKATITPEELERRAAAAYDEVRAEMLRIARELWPSRIGDEPMPDDTDLLTRRVLDAIAVEHPRADELLDYCTRRARSGSRRSSASATSSACPTRRSRSSGPRPSCAPSVARCSSRRGRSTRGSTASSPSRRRRRAGATSRSSRCSARTTRARSASSPSTRRCRGTTSSSTGRTDAPRCRARSSAPASSPRAGRCT